MSKLTDILDKFERHLLVDHPDADQTQPCLFKQDVEQAILALIAEAIGEDESDKKDKGYETDTFRTMYRNQLRAEIRERLGL